MRKYQKFMKIALCAVLVSFLPISAAKSGSTPLSSEEFTLELEKGSQDEWELRDQNGTLRGVVTSREGDTFRMYDAGGRYIGFVFALKMWVPTGARQRRELRVNMADIELYLNILTAVGSTSVQPQELAMVPKKNAGNEWELRNQNDEIVGSLRKGDVRFRLFDGGGGFMGFIDPSGFWLPRLGLNRREMRIAPEQARFSLDAYKAIVRVK
jgi:hypothetical protein